MAIALTRTPKFRWQDYDLNELKKEYYELGLLGFMKKYKTGHEKVYKYLGYIPKELRKKTGNGSDKIKERKLERFEATTKVAKMYEEKMSKIQAPKYTGPFMLKRF